MSVHPSSREAASPGLSARAWLGMACVAVLLAAAVLRFAGLSWDMPFSYHPDEPVNLIAMQGMLRDGTANPKTFVYGSLFYYLHVPGQLAVWLLDGKLQPILWQMMGSAFVPQPEAFLTARALTACLGIGIVAGVMVLARDAGLGVAAILFAGALAAVNPLLAGHSRMIAPDVPAAFFCTLALIGAMRVLTGGATSAYVFAAVMTGLAASTKYNAGLVGLAIAAAHVLRAGVSPAKAGPLVLAGAISLAAFLVTSPYMILDWPNASAGILREIHHYRTGHPGYEGDTLRTNLTWLWGAFGAALCLIVLAALHPARRIFVPLALFTGAYFTLISVQVVRFDRNLMPIIPPLIVLAAAGFDILVGALRARLQPRLRSAIAVLFAVALLVPGDAGARRHGRALRRSAKGRPRLDRCERRARNVRFHGFLQPVS